jgi:hypothetical protein
MHRAVAVAIGWGALEVGLSPVFALERPNGPERHQRTIALTLNRELQTFDDPITTPAPRLTDPLIPFVGRDLALRHPLQTGGSQSAPPPPGCSAPKARPRRPAMPGLAPAAGDPRPLSDTDRGGQLGQSGFPRTTMAGSCAPPQRVGGRNVQAERQTGKYSANKGIALSSISDALTGERGIELVFRVEHFQVRLES